MRLMKMFEIDVTEYWEVILGVAASVTIVPFMIGYAFSALMRMMIK